MLEFELEDEWDGWSGIREQVIENIKDSLEEGMKKIVENEELIEEYNEGETVQVV